MPLIIGGGNVDVGLKYLDEQARQRADALRQAQVLQDAWNNSARIDQTNRQLQQQAQQNYAATQQHYSDARDRMLNEQADRDARERAQALQLGQERDFHQDALNQQQWRNQFDQQNQQNENAYHNRALDVRAADNAANNARALEVAKARNAAQDTARQQAALNHVEQNTRAELAQNPEYQAHMRAYKDHRIEFPEIAAQEEAAAKAIYDATREKHAKLLGVDAHSGEDQSFPQVQPADLMGGYDVERGQGTWMPPDAETDAASDFPQARPSEIMGDYSADNGQAPLQGDGVTPTEAPAVRSNEDVWDKLIPDLKGEPTRDDVERQIQRFDAIQNKMNTGEEGNEGDTGTAGATGNSSDPLAEAEAAALKRVEDLRAQAKKPTNSAEAYAETARRKALVQAEKEYKEAAARKANAHVQAVHDESALSMKTERERKAKNDEEKLKEKKDTIDGLVQKYVDVGDPEATPEEQLDKLKANEARLNGRLPEDLTGSKSLLKEVTRLGKTEAIRGKIKSGIAVTLSPDELEELGRAEWERVHKTEAKIPNEVKVKAQAAIEAKRAEILDAQKKADAAPIPYYSGEQMPVQTSAEAKAPVKVQAAMEVKPAPTMTRNGHTYVLKKDGSGYVLKE